MYPSFAEDDIHERFKVDLETFLETQLKNNSVDKASAHKLKHFQSVLRKKFSNTVSQSHNDASLFMNNFIHSVFPGVVAVIHRIRNRDSNISPSLVGFDYSHEISSFSLHDQQKLWMLRTFLFYQLLIVTCKLCRNEQLFTDTFPERKFHAGVATELHMYKIGIFGSLNPTSDIDVGVQYAGNIIADGLAYLVCTVEDIFLKFAGISSLKLDIELYADMMTLTDEKGDVFYLDSQHFKHQEFHDMIPYVEASILRNYVTAKLSPEMRSEEAVRECIQNFSFRDFNALLHQDKKLKGFFEKYVSKYKLGFRNVSEKARELVVEYMSADYDHAREAYYDRVNRAEVEVSKVRTMYAEQHKLSLKPSEIVIMMQLIAEALVFRAESYTCSDSVMHVVRVLQASASTVHNNKLPASFPDSCEMEYDKLTKAFCNIGMYGYFISIYEQLGYIYRFYLTYCIPETAHYDKIKCLHKHDKYAYRVENALQMLQPFDKDKESNSGVGGGLKSKKKKKRGIKSRNARSRR